MVEIFGGYNKTLEALLCNPSSTPLLRPRDATSPARAIRFRVEGLGSGVWGLWFGVLGLGFWVLGFGFWVLGFGFWVLGFGFWVWGLGERAELIKPWRIQPWQN